MTSAGPQGPWQQPPPGQGPYRQPSHPPQHAHDPRAGLPGPWQGQRPGPVQPAPFGLHGPAPLPGGQQPPPPQQMLQPRRPGAVRTLTWVAVVIVLALCTLATMLVIGLSTGITGSLVGLLLAILPVFPVATALLWLDRYEDEPPLLLGFAFAWGATAAVIIALVFSIGSMVVISTAGGGDDLGAVVVAPVVEESAKGLAVLLVLVIRRGQFNGVVDGIVYAGLSGLGFAFAENILYLGSAFLDGGLTSAIVLFVLRCVMGPFAHPMFTAAFGIGLGLAVRTTNGALKAVYPLAGISVAMMLHALWNGMAIFGGEGFFIGYVLIQLPIFAAFVVFAVIVRRREGRLIAEHLRIYAETGWITGQELAMLSSPVGRRQARAWAAHVGGGPGRKSMRDFQELASELSFLRERMHKGAADARARQTEVDLLRTMWQLRQGFTPRIG